MAGANKQLRRQGSSGEVSGGCPCPQSPRLECMCFLAHADISSMHDHEGSHTGLPVSCRSSTDLTSASANTIMVCRSDMLLV